MIAILLALSVSASQAASKATLIDSKGVTLTVDVALARAAQGDKVYRCQEVKPSVSKSGTSVSFKVAK